MTIYRGYDIVPHAKGGFTWTDERGFEHFQEGVTQTTYPSEDAAMDGVDAYKRKLAAVKITGEGFSDPAPPMARLPRQLGNSGTNPISSAGSKL